MEAVLADSCFWLVLVDAADHIIAGQTRLLRPLILINIILPWPCLYETISTHLARTKERLIYFEALINRSDVLLLDDSDYKFSALKETFILKRLGFTYSLTDSVIREILKEVDITIRYLVTFNTDDSEDICQRRQITIFN